MSGLKIGIMANGRVAVIPSLFVCSLSIHIHSNHP